MLDASLRSGGSRVILLEDDVGLRDVLLELFSDEGFEVDACTTLDEIYTALQQHPGAVVVADSWTAGDYVATRPVPADGNRGARSYRSAHPHHWQSVGPPTRPASVAIRHDCCQTIRPR